MRFQQLAPLAGLVAAVQAGVHGTAPLGTGSVSTVWTTTVVRTYTPPSMLDVNIFSSMTILTNSSHLHHLLP